MITPHHIEVNHAYIYNSFPILDNTSSSFVTPTKKSKEKIAPFNNCQILKQKKAHTTTYGKAEKIRRFNKILNYVFARTTKQERDQYGLLIPKEQIKYKAEEDLNKPRSQLSYHDRITKKLYKIYNNIKKS